MTHRNVTVGGSVTGSSIFTGDQNIVTTYTKTTLPRPRRAYILPTNVLRRAFPLCGNRSRECTHFPHKVAETALAHVLKDPVEAAYAMTFSTSGRAKLGTNRPRILPPALLFALPSPGPSCRKDRASAFRLIVP